MAEPGAREEIDAACEALLALITTELEDALELIVRADRRQRLAELQQGLARMSLLASAAVEADGIAR